MRIKKSTLFSLKECFAAYMAVKKSNYPQAMQDEITRKLFDLTDFRSAQIQSGKVPKTSRDAQRATVVQSLQDTLGPMTVDESIDLAREMRGYCEEILQLGCLAEGDAQSLREALELQNWLRSLFGAGEHKHSVSRGKRELQNRN